MKESVPKGIPVDFALGKFTPVVPLRGGMFWIAHKKTKQTPNKTERLAVVPTSP
jgi:hypothetical protein